MLALAVLWILAIGLGVRLMTQGLSRVVGEHSMVAQMDHLNIPGPAFRAIGSAETVAGAGLVIGAVVLDPPWIGLAAAMSAMLVTVALLTFHQLVRDQLTEVLPTLVPGVICTIYVIALLTAST